MPLPICARNQLIFDLLFRRVACQEGSSEPTLNVLLSMMNAPRGAAAYVQATYLSAAGLSRLHRRLLVEG